MIENLNLKSRNNINHLVEKRSKEIFYVKKARTERLRKSAIVNMQKLLNKEESKKKDLLRKISNYVPVNYDCMQSLSLRK